MSLTQKTKNWCNYMPTRRFGKYSFTKNLEPSLNTEYKIISKGGNLFTQAGTSGDKRMENS